MVGRQYWVSPVALVRCLGTLSESLLLKKWFWGVRCSLRYNYSVDHWTLKRLAGWPMTGKLTNMGILETQVWFPFCMCWIDERCGAGLAQCSGDPDVVPLTGDNGRQDKKKKKKKESSSSSSSSSEDDSPSDLGWLLMKLNPAKGCSRVNSIYSIQCVCKCSFETEPYNCSQMSWYHPYLRNLRNSQICLSMTPLSATL